jgi:putative DNA primase/helicase
MAACKLGSLVAGGVLETATVACELASAGMDAGLAEREVAATIHSGMSKGMETPRSPESRNLDVPFRPGASVAKTGVSGADPWPEPASLGESLLPVLPFQAECLPVALRGWVADIAERLQAPVEYAAGAAMTIAGALIGRQIALKPGRYDDWMVVPNFWCCLIGPPSAMKSPSLAQARKPLDRLEGDAAKEYGAAMAEYKKRVAVVDAKTKKAKKDLQESVNDEEQSDLQADFLAGSIPDAPTPPVCRRYFTSDSTTEKLIELMRDNPRGILILRDELVAFLESLDRSGREGDRSFYCEAWNALGAFVQDRIGRGCIRTEACCASILGCATPGKIRSYVAEALADGDGADGFLQRFQLLLWPDVSEEWQRVDRWPNTADRDLAYEAIRGLNRIDITALGAERDKYDEGEGVPFLRFAPDAQLVWDDWYSEHMKRGRKDKDEHPAVLSHLGKMQKTVAAIALTCHILDSGQGPVTLDALRKALSWYDLLESHARRLYSAGASVNVTVARRLWRKITQGCLPNGFTARDVRRKCWSGLSTDETVRGALKELEVLGYLREQTIHTGGKPKVIFSINPKAEVAHEQAA